MHLALVFELYRDYSFFQKYSAVFSNVASQHIFVRSLHVLFVDCLCVLRLPPSVKKHVKLRVRLIGYAKLPVGVDGVLLFMTPNWLSGRRWMDGWINTVTIGMSLECRFF